ncbi:hypothetical protein H4J59_04710 [Colwellia sp. MB02u-10]|uniref:hypothetical protein n=1 Tax=Colwellia sp. MB02u-10 TaxID=2759828 RepID=UPI0015F784FA|nr:hypothetical protein [Colwellia sp. MB02u-10]MBA6340296.1 hypothetical protein [Colwellia sp. MB02u-10]
MHKSTLDFINKNIQTNANSSSYPVRKKEEEEKIISAPAATPIKLKTADKHKD